MMEKLKPGLYASKDGSRVACLLMEYETDRGPRAHYFEVLPEKVPANSVAPTSFRRRYPLRVVRCEVER